MLDLGNDVFGGLILSTHIVKYTNEGIPFTKLTALPTCTETRNLGVPNSSNSDRNVPEEMHLKTRDLLDWNELG